MLLHCSPRVKFPRVTGEFGLLSNVGEDTFGYCVHSTHSTVVRPLCNDSARAISFSFPSP